MKILGFVFGLFLIGFNGIAQESEGITITNPEKVRSGGDFYEQCMANAKASLECDYEEEEDDLFDL